MKRKKLTVSFLLVFLCSCTSIKPHLKKSDIDTRQGKVSIINAIGLNEENVYLIGKPHKDQNNSDIIRQEYSLQVDF